MLTRKGVCEEAKITARYLKYKVREYETLKMEIKELREEIAGIS